MWGKNDQKIYDISGPCIPCSCGGDVQFQVRNLKVFNFKFKNLDNINFRSKVLEEKLLEKLPRHGEDVVQKVLQTPIPSKLNFLQEQMWLQKRL